MWLSIFFNKLAKLCTWDDWTLKVIHGVHNHPTVEYLESHSYVGRLSVSETSITIEMSKC